PDTLQAVNSAVALLDAWDHARFQGLKSMLDHGQIGNHHVPEFNGLHDGNTILVNCDTVKTVERALWVLMHEYDHVTHSDGQDGHFDPRSDPKTYPSDPNDSKAQDKAAEKEHGKIQLKAADDLCAFSLAFCGVVTISCKEIMDAYVI